MIRLLTQNAGQQLNGFGRLRALLNTAMIYVMPARVATLNRPFAGTAGNEELAEYTGVKMSGTWILEVIDDTIGGTNVVNLAKLQITGATPSGVA